MLIPPLAVAVLLALSAPAAAKDDAAEAFDKAKAGAAPPSVKPKTIEAPAASPVEVGHVLDDNGIRYEGGILGCTNGGVPGPLFETMRGRSKALREYRARLAGIAWGAVASSEEAGSLYFFAGPKTVHRDMGAPAFTAYWKAKVSGDRDSQGANGIAVQQALASDPELPRLARLWWERLEAASAPLKAGAEGMRKAAAEAKAKVEAKHGLSLTDEVLRAPLTLVYGEVDGPGRAVRDCDHWSLYVPRGKKACAAAAALFANREAHAAHKDWPPILGQLGAGGAYFVIEAADPVPKKNLTGTFVLTKKDLTPESASACEEGQSRKPKVKFTPFNLGAKIPTAADAPRPDGRSGVWGLLPDAESRRAWDAEVKACAEGTVIESDYHGYYATSPSAECFDARDALAAAACGIPQDKRFEIAQKTCGQVTSVAEAQAVERIINPGCPGEPMQNAEEFKVYECWMRDADAPKELRCHALYAAALALYYRGLGLGPPPDKLTLRDDLRATYGLGALCPES